MVDGVNGLPGPDALLFVLDKRQEIGPVTTLRLNMEDTFALGVTRKKSSVHPTPVQKVNF